LKNKSKNEGIEIPKEDMRKIEFLIKMELEFEHHDEN
jgi:hypothetical protein